MASLGSLGSLGSLSMQASQASLVSLAGVQAPSQVSPSRFNPGSGFQHNFRVALALVPSLVVLAQYGGNAVAGGLVVRETRRCRPIGAALPPPWTPAHAIARSLAAQVGFLAMYILDAVRFKEGAFFANWLTMGAANLALVFSNLLMGSELPFVLSLLGFLLGGATLLLTGMPRNGAARPAGAPAARPPPSWRPGPPARPVHPPPAPAQACG
jgi:hypothetical protein